MNPYWGNHFFEFFQTFAFRIKELFSGGEPFSDEVQFIVLGLTAISCGLIGPFLVLKKMSMFANSLSHTILIGVIVAYLISSHFWGGGLMDFSTLFLGALFAAFLTAFLTEGLVRLFRLQEDASIGLVFTALFALGVILVTIYTKNIHLSVEVVMGNVDALQKKDIGFSSVFSLLNLGAILLFYRKFQIASFDYKLAKSLGIKSGIYHFLLLFLAAFTIIGAFRAVGVLLVLSFLVGPYLTARLFFHRLSTLLVMTPLFGVGVSFLAVALSRHLLSYFDLAVSTGALASCLIGALYFLSLFSKFCFKPRISLAKAEN